MANGVKYGRRAGDHKPRVLLATQAAAPGALQELTSKLPAELLTAHTVSECVARLSGGHGISLLLIEGRFGCTPALHHNGGSAPRGSTNGTLLPPELTSIAHQTQTPFVIFSSATDSSTLRQAQSIGAEDYILMPYHTREVVSKLRAALSQERRLACIGGGTGLFTLLSGLKHLPNMLLTSIVNMSDDGGSSGKLRTAMGILPPGDVRRSLVALSNAPELMNELMQFRFREGDSLEQHNLGNLILAGLTQLRGSMLEAVRALGDLLDIQGVVIPSSATLSDLVARMTDGTIIRGESRIGEHLLPPGQRIVELWHEPEAEPNPEASAAILYADTVLLGPGDLFTSVLTNLCIPSIREALAATSANVIYICNLMTKPSETPGFTASDHVAEVIRYLGGDSLDMVVVSNTALSDHAIQEYARQDQHPVLLHELERLRAVTSATIVPSDVGHETELVRHDSVKLARTIAELIGIPANGLTAL